MKAALFSYQYGLKIVETDEPKLDPDEVLVEIRSAGLCASDLHYMHGRFKYSIDPIIPGHEGSGVIKEVGKSVEKTCVGDRVVIDYVKGCGKCRYCRLGKENRCINAKFYGFDLNGTFAEYMVVSEDNIVPLPNNISFEEGSITGCAVVTPYHAIKAVDGVWDRDVAVIGLGGVGIHGVLLSHLLGANHIIGVDIDKSKRDIAYKYGADYFINPDEEDPVAVVHSLLGDGVDIAFEFVGTPQTIHLALDITKTGGISLIAGLVGGEVSVDFHGLISREKRIVTTEDHTHHELTRLLRLLSSRNVDLKPSITHRSTLDKLPEAITLLDKKYEPVIRIVINRF